MLNEHEDKYNGSDDSEYHFSDEEVSYESEADAAKPVVVAPEKNPLANLAQSKRMLISLGVFLGLVFVVYKMVAPSSTPPSTDITPAANTVTPMTSQASSMPAPTMPAPSAPVQAAPMPAAAMPASPSPQTMSQTPSAQAMMPAAAPAASVAPAPASTEDAPDVQGALMTAPPGPAEAASPVTTTTAQPASNTATPLMNSLDTSSAQMSAANQQLMAQLQADYAQRLADYQAQNKVLQDQVQTLNNRVASMESEMSQLVQTLTKAFQNNGADASADVTAPDAATAPIAAPDIKLPYSVQAIIPGRAWLRADNGETLTVTEGDVIKDVGQVSKIDPYNGIVEIKVGNKTVTLSYGNNG